MYDTQCRVLVSGDTLNADLKGFSSLESIKLREKISFSIEILAQKVSCQQLSSQIFGIGLLKHIG